MLRKGVPSSIAVILRTTVQVRSSVRCEGLADRLTSPMERHTVPISLMPPLGHFLLQSRLGVLLTVWWLAPVLLNGHILEDHIHSHVQEDLTGHGGGQNVGRQHHLPCRRS